MSKTLAELQIGDEVITENERGSMKVYGLEIVTRMTKTLLVTNVDRKYAISDGTGRGNPSHPRRIAHVYNEGKPRLMTAQDVSDIREQEAKARDRREKIRYITRYLEANRNASKLTDEKLAEIYALLGGE